MTHNLGVLIILPFVYHNTVIKLLSLSTVVLNSRAETNTRFARVFARLHKYLNTKRGIRIHIYIEFLHYFLYFL